MKTLEMIFLSMKPGRLLRAFLIFAPVVYYGGSGNMAVWLKAFVAFLIFALLTGVINIIDDIADYEKDKKGPSKKLSPISNGELSLNKAEFSAGMILIGAFVAAFFLGPAFGIVSIAYFFVEMCYYLVLKNTPIIDALTVSVEISLIMIAGGIASGTPASPWLLVFVLSLATLINFCDKRRSFIYYKKKEASISGFEYDKRTLESLVMINASFAVILYTLLCLSVPGANSFLYYSIPLAMYMVYRLIFLMNSGSDKIYEKLLTRDIPFWVTVVLMAVSFLAFPFKPI